MQNKRSLGKAYSMCDIFSFKYTRNEEATDGTATLNCDDDLLLSSPAHLQLLVLTWMNDLFPETTSVV